MPATSVVNTTRDACYFCKSKARLTRLVNYRVGPTGKRGTYRRRICVGCVNKHIHNIRGPWEGR